MSLAPSIRRFSFGFATAFAAFYPLAVGKDLALFTVYPTIGVVLWGTRHAQDAAPALGGIPAMFWYGWTATAALGALTVGLAVALIPARWSSGAKPGWLWLPPAAAMLACAYITLPWFR